MPRLKIAFATVGCRANQADSDTILHHLDTRHSELTRDFDQAELVVINTCCVTAEAERDCRKLVRRALSASSTSRVLLTGCAVSALPDFSHALGPRVIVLPWSDTWLQDTAAHLNELSARSDGDGPAVDSQPNRRRHTRGLLKIQNGCSHGCSYCIVPKARGPEQSLLPQDILEEIDRFAAQGYVEIVITGVQLGAWGQDLPSQPKLADWVVTMAERFKPGRIRLSSIEPWSVGPELIEAIASCDRICPHLHLPLQSGSDGILQAMGRDYTSAQYRDLIALIRKHIPDVAIGTDLILGFPGEDELAFEQTVHFLEQIKPAYLHAFPYSPRPLTKAATFGGRPPRQVAKERVRIIRGLGSKYAYEYRQHLLGQVRQVVIEDFRAQETRGMTDTFVPTVFHEQGLHKGQLVFATMERILSDGRVASSACQTGQK